VHPWVGVHSPFLVLLWQSLLEYVTQSLVCCRSLRSEGVVDVVVAKAEAAYMWGGVVALQEGRSKGRKRYRRVPLPSSAVVK
jgi:hypothetical protein